MTVRRCHDCHRPLRLDPAGWIRGQPLGPKCWADRGGTPTTPRATTRPGAVGGDDLLHALAEILANDTDDTP
jgi:hypothetical protein